LQYRPWTDNFVLNVGSQSGKKLTYHLPRSAILRLGNQYLDELNPDAGFQAFVRVWKGYQRHYGNDSKITLSALRLVAIHHQNKHEGENLARTAVQQSSKLWGARDSKTMDIENDLLDLQTTCALSEGRLTEAELYCEKFLEVSQFPHIHTCSETQV